MSFEPIRRPSRELAFVVSSIEPVNPAALEHLARPLNRVGVLPRLDEHVSRQAPAVGATARVSGA